MAAQLTSAGVEAETAGEIFADLGAAVQASTGRSDLDVSTRSPFGRLAWPVAERLADVQGLLSTLLYALDPETAAGTTLDVVALLRGTRRLPASASTITLRAIGAPGTDVSGRLVRSSEGDLWIAPSGTVIGALGYVEAVFAAEEDGPLEGSGPWSIVSDLPGWTSVVEVGGLELGEYAETDPDLRSRLAESLSQALGTEPAIYAALAQVPGVDLETLWVDVNRTDSPHPTTGLPAHHVEALVQGGTNAAIAAALVASTSSVAGFFGNTLEVVTLSNGQTRDVYFTRPTAQRLFASVEVDTAGATSSLPADAEATLRAALVEWGAALKPRRPVTAASAERVLSPLLPETSFSDVTVLLSLDGMTYDTYAAPDPRSYGEISDEPSPAQVLGSVGEPYTLGAGWQLDLSINGGPTQSTVFGAMGPGATAAAVAAVFALSGATASDGGGVLLLETDLTGATRSIEILGSSTGALLAALGLSVGTTTGRDSDITYTVV